VQEDNKKCEIMEKMKKILTTLVLVLCIVGVSLVTIADPANAAEMSAYEKNIRLNPIGTVGEDFVAVQPGGDLAYQCQKFCQKKQECVAIYFSEDTPARCYYYRHYGFILVDATGYNTSFKIWTEY